MGARSLPLPVLCRRVSQCRLVRFSPAFRQKGVINNCFPHKGGTTNRCDYEQAGL
jgi:hypothetical protein